ncbi:MAG: MBL fold metallo-hydrolase [Ruminococcaceae bacterium]|nr:MBL fold metallo-hydrolase [Oscillospiraceae bacterium]
MSLGDAPMELALRVTLVANAGVLLEYDGTTLLVDGIYGREGHPFSNLSDETWRKLLEAEHPFETVDYLLFTHAHPDHLSPEMTLDFLKRRAVKGVFLPDTRSVRESGLVSWLAQSGTPAVLLSNATDHAAYRIEPRIEVRSFRTQHLDKAFEQVKHFCYLLTFGEKRVLLTADADYVHEDFACLDGERLRAVFVNPLFFSALRTGRFFRGTLDTETVCVYHIPFREDDATGMRGRLAHAYALWGAERPPALLLSEPFERLSL